MDHAGAGDAGVPGANGSLGRTRFQIAALTVRKLSGGVDDPDAEGFGGGDGLVSGGDALKEADILAFNAVGGRTGRGTGVRGDVRR